MENQEKLSADSASVKIKEIDKRTYKDKGN